MAPSLAALRAVADRGGDMAMDDPEVYERARKRVRQIKGFYIHALVYVLVNLLLIALNLSMPRGGVWVPWSLWPLFGWGIGLAAHGLSVFDIAGLWGAEWEERKIKEIIDKRRPH
jgi:hypothetical protein